MLSPSRLSHRTTTALVLVTPPDFGTMTVVSIVIVGQREMFRARSLAPLVKARGFGMTPFKRGAAKASSMHLPLQGRRVRLTDCPAIRLTRRSLRDFQPELD